MAQSSLVELDDVRLRSRDCGRRYCDQYAWIEQA